MAPYYRHITSPIDPTTSTSPPTNTAAPLPFDTGVYEDMLAKNKAELESLDTRLAEAEKTEGESDVADLLRSRAMYLVRIGDKVRYLFHLCTLNTNLSCRKRHFPPCH